MVLWMVLLDSCLVLIWRRGGRAGGCVWCIGYHIGAEWIAEIREWIAEIREWIARIRERIDIGDIAQRERGDFTQSELIHMSESSRSGPEAKHNEWLARLAGEG
jgi:hypothetical protein